MPLTLSEFVVTAPHLTAWTPAHLPLHKAQDFRLAWFPGRVGRSINILLKPREIRVEASDSTHCCAGVLVLEVLQARHSVRASSSWAGRCQQAHNLVDAVGHLPCILPAQRSGPGGGQLPPGGATPAAAARSARTGVVALDRVSAAAWAALRLNTLRLRRVQAPSNACWHPTQNEHGDGGSKC